MPTRTVVWTAGVEPSSVVARLGLPLDDGGRIVVDEHLRVSGVDDVWAIGDAAAVPYPGDPSRACPPTRQHAIRQGDVAGANVAARLGAGRAAPYRHHDRGVFVGLGRTQGVAELFGVRLRGRVAWLLTGLYNLKQVPGRVSKLRLLNDWLLDLLLPRISTETGQAAYPVGAGRTAPADASAVGALSPSAVSETLTLRATDDRTPD